MKLFKAIHIRKKHILVALAAIACVGLCTQLVPPAAAKVSAIVSAKTERKLPIYCVQTDKPQVSISFDAAWGAEDTDNLLQILANNNVKATFFLCGYWVEDYPEEVKKIAEAGHDLGNHSSTHPHMNQLSSEQIAKELADCHAAVKNLTGLEMDLFRPPFGEYNNTVIDTAFASSYYPIQWDIETLDTKIFVENITYLGVFYWHKP
ncbi:MAG: polysaccharide deacetylase family protein [Clostridia bacterium]|nr:polysaccharide deacetylase family protein [Clostridia bacterium]